MNNKRLSRTFRVTALVLVIVLLLPVGAMAAEPRSSLYLDAYSAYVYRAGWGKIQVWFDVQGTNDMDEIGALEIRMYESKDNENWTWVKTFDYTDYSDMLAYNDYIHVGHVEYNGTLGRYYKAYVCVWAGKNGDGDTRYFWTNSEKATLFAE
ncbi:MAG: hypothetical protein IJA45_03205 [Oscillospiraceae bacterium]|nr:hypothetical protein [Oscillospiraceae bacterium]